MEAFSIGTQLYDAGDYSAARTEFLKAITQATSPVDKANALYCLGKAEYHLGHYKKATRAYRESLKYQPTNAICLYNLGVALTRWGKYTEALEAYNKAIAANPDDSDAWYNKGIVLGELDRPQEALDCIQRSFVINPDSVATAPSLNIIAELEAQLA